MGSRVRRSPSPGRVPVGWALLCLVVLASCTAPPPTPFTTGEPTPLPPTASAAPPPTSTPTPPDLCLTADDLVLYPGPEFYSGDVIGFDVTPRSLGQVEPAAVMVRIYHQTVDGAHVIAEGQVSYPSFDEVPRARMPWAWDTAGLEGEQVLVFWIDPDDLIQEGDEDPNNNIVQQTVRLLPATRRPPLEIAAVWTTSTVDCCTLHFLTGTAAERDAALIVQTAERAVAPVQELIGAQLREPLDIYLIDRMIGHGGYVNQSLTLSYLDRDYTGDHLETVLRHEATHALDREVVQGWPPAMLREGLAVWVAGGHYGPEPIPERAAALLDLGWYVPLEELADGFYQHQHEIGYLEAAALIAYLVETHGWAEVLYFYTTFDPGDKTSVEALDAALTDSFGYGLAELEAGFLQWLDRHHPSPDQMRHLLDTVTLYDTIRAYQQLYDPRAYYASTWLPNPAEAVERGIEADFLRQPRTQRHMALETMLISARRALDAGEFVVAEALVRAVSDTLDRGAFVSPVAAEYLAIVRAAAAVGYEAQHITLQRRAAVVEATAGSPDLVELRLARTTTGWVLIH